MIQDIGEKKFDNQYRPDAKMRDDDYLFVVRDQDRSGQILIRIEDGSVVVPRVRDFNVSREDVRYLFAIDDEQFFMIKEGVEYDIPEGYAFESMRALRTGIPADMCMAGTTANHLHIFYRDNKFCGKCGAPTQHDEKLRALKCPKCGNLIFPRINPAVIIGLRNGDSLMVSRYANRPMSAGVALLAGFCEIGETAEETVVREVMEEVGLRATNIQYYGSQPWGFAGNMSLGYFADVEGDTTVTLDEEELACAEFVKREDLPEPASMVSITATMIEEFRNGNW